MNLMEFLLFTAPAVVLVLGGYGIVRHLEAHDQSGRRPPGQ